MWVKNKETGLTWEIPDGTDLAERLAKDPAYEQVLEPRVGEGGKALEHMTRDELLAKAKELGLDLPGNTSKAKALEAVQEAMAANARDSAGGQGGQEGGA